MSNLLLMYDVILFTVMYNRLTHWKPVVATHLDVANRSLTVVVEPMLELIQSEYVLQLSNNNCRHDVTVRNHQLLNPAFMSLFCILHNE